ncbi:uncharacterized protein [Procambarus clarkii]|uniref:uncharacterized protein n=1 Tax=Procambarus clarkii TaxID=6728 RepID=UPI003741EAA0
MLPLGGFPSSQETNLPTPAARSDRRYSQYDENRSLENREVFAVGVCRHPSRAEPRACGQAQCQPSDKTSKSGGRSCDWISPLYTPGEGASPSQLYSDSINSYQSQAPAAAGWPAVSPPHYSPSPWAADTGFSKSEQPVTLSGRKLKVYEWPEQSDQELEKKRLRAIKAVRNRRRNAQRVEELQQTLDNMEEEIKILLTEKHKREDLVTQMQAKLDMVHLSTGLYLPMNCLPT